MCPRYKIVRVWEVDSENENLAKVTQLGQELNPDVTAEETIVLAEGEDDDVIVTVKRKGDDDPK